MIYILNKGRDDCKMVTMYSSNVCTVIGPKGKYSYYYNNNFINELWNTIITLTVVMKMN